MSNSMLWKELTAEDLRGKAAAGAVVILPVASIEQHGPHLPTGVDTILTGRSAGVPRRR
jgi:creatinine amidohydrolase